MPKNPSPLDHNPLWYKDAIIYQVHIKAFYDANGDGIGDFTGLTQKLNYLESLGITAIWLLPFYPSPLRDDGYDIADYFNVHPNYGTMADFQRFLNEAHRRGLRVITELVVNHTSDQHPWFQRARRAAPGSIERDFYVWSDNPNKYSETRIIFQDFEPSNWTLDPIAKQYYWHRFYHHQPDLNYDSPHVQTAVIEAMDAWLAMGVDGLRLDAVPYLYEREGTNCENLPETHQFLKRLRAYIDEKYPDRMLLSEANQWPEDAVAYFGKGDETHMAFHFPLMPRLFMAIQMEDRFPIIDILKQTPAIPDACQWAIFLRNHDELTLEMVTDEERDFMYKAYAKDPKARINLGIRRRLAPLLENDRRKIELMNILLLSLPGTPVIYYGDEIGMGDNLSLDDRNGVRTPMQWNADRNAGFSKARKLFLPIVIDPEYRHETLNVETQEKSPSSLLSWMKQIIATRKRLPALTQGRLDFLSSDNPRILAFVRAYKDEKVLVALNLSKYPQVADLDISSCSGYFPEEVLSRNPFPAIGETPYSLTFGAYGYYLFSLKKPVTQGSQKEIPEMGTISGWEALLQGQTKNRFEQAILPHYLNECRWFSGKARGLQGTKIVETIWVGQGKSKTPLLFVEAHYTEGFCETYLLPLAFATDSPAKRIMKDLPHGVIAHLTMKTTKGILCDAVYDETFRQNLLTMITKQQSAKGMYGDLTGEKSFRKIVRGQSPMTKTSSVLTAEQSNTSILYPNGLILKLYRRLEEGGHPDLEMGRFLTRERSANTPPFAGLIAYQRPASGPTAVGLLSGFIPNKGDAWGYTANEIKKYLGRVQPTGGTPPAGTSEWTAPAVPEAATSPMALADQEIPATVRKLIGRASLEMAALLGKRTGELHLTLLSNREDPSFSPEPFTTLYQRSLYQSFQSFAQRTLQLLKKRIKHLPDAICKEAEGLLQREDEILGRYKGLIGNLILVMKIRIHGDYHLGQVLCTGTDFVIIDFEGEPARSLGERRLKRCALQDVAGMLRSFHYAAYSGLFATLKPEDIPVFTPWADLWSQTVGGVFLRSYRETVGDAPILPNDSKALEMLLCAFLLNKAIYELGYELNNRPDWVRLPLKGILSILDMKVGTQ
jgi:maltose alpha-D-glucosyltransferase/alpha-amylase